MFITPIPLPFLFPSPGQTFLPGALQSPLHLQSLIFLACSLLQFIPRDVPPERRWWQKCWGKNFTTNLRPVRSTGEKKSHCHIQLLRWNHYRELSETLEREKREREENRWKRQRDTSKRNEDRTRRRRQERGDKNHEVRTRLNYWSSWEMRDGSTVLGSDEKRSQGTEPRNWMNGENEQWWGGFHLVSLSVMGRSYVSQQRAQSERDQGNAENQQQRSVTLLVWL